MTMRHPKKLKTFLGELRAGQDATGAAIVAEMTPAEGERHAAAERRGEYADVVGTEPSWSIVDDVLTIGGFDLGKVTWSTL